MDKKMKYRWLEEITSETLEQAIGYPIDSITVGNIIVGYDGDRPIMKRGIEIDLASDTPEVLERLDLLLPGLRREGGKDFLAALDSLTDRVDALESAKTP